MVVSEAYPPAGVCGVEQLGGGRPLLAVYGQELDGGLEVRAGETRIRVRAVLLGRAAAVAVGQGVATRERFA